MTDTEAYTMPDDDEPPSPKVKVSGGPMDDQKFSVIDALAKDAKPLTVFEPGEDIHAVKESAAMAKRAIRERWPVPGEVMKEVIDRARRMVNKETKTVATMAGAVEVDADDVAGVGMKVILAANAQNQADDHIEDKNARLDAGKATENVVERVIKVEFDKRG